MKASPKAIEFINRANMKRRNIAVYYRKNILLQTEYEISGMVLAWQMHAKDNETRYYMSYFRSPSDQGTVNPSHEKIYYKYRRIYLEKMERESER
ncbi:hypothetical protein RBH29_14435 [Herbivorax sp. ANBcel31]|uniref:hypothetical protein n=1 Tax=Herbivorax sp. ANBcel31 TaxID=3069754 RepID=UPI0027B13C24|nr:hypothetical protein [Herbivorax sp. ANBcel31]MDQ2087627.1 hypothetical protein [Herbivorax sp. ANBcel31]